MNGLADTAIRIQPAVSGGRSIHSPALVWLVPLGMVAAILAVSPNFQAARFVRSHPLGGDFLQEWVGGRLVHTAQAAELYRSNRARQLQHDARLVGFSWPCERYFPMVYPPFYYLVVSPFSALPYATAAVLWLMVTAAAFAASGWLLMNYYPCGRRLLPLAIVVAILFAPLWFGLHTGQKSTILLLLFTSTFLLLYQGRPLCAGMVFGLVLFKPHLAVLVGAAMLCKRQWPFVVGASATGAVAALLSLSVGAGVCGDYLRVCLGTTDYVQTAGYQLSAAHSWWGAWSMLFGGHWPLVAKACTLLSTLLCVGLVVVLLRGPLDYRSPRFAVQFSGLVFATVLTAPHLYTYDLTLLLLPMFLIAVQLLPRAARLGASGKCLLCSCAALLLGAGLAAESIRFFPVQLTVAAMFACLWLAVVQVSWLPTRCAPPVAE